MQIRESFKDPFDFPTAFDYQPFILRAQNLLHHQTCGSVFAGLKYLHLHEIKKIAILSRETHASLMPIIVDCFSFRIKPSQKFTTITPKRLVTVEYDINMIGDKYFRVNPSHAPLPSLAPSITHLSLLDHIYFPHLNFNILTHLELVSIVGSIDNLPPSLQLTIGSSFNKPIDHLPSGLTHLRITGITCSFNKSIDHLPASLIFLQIDSTFNQPIDYLPPNLTHLIFGQCDCNQPVDNLPNNLLILSLGNTFNHSVDHLPDSLQHLSLGSDFKQSLDYLPPKLVTLRLQTDSLINLSYIPHSIKHLTCNISSISHLPSSITHYTTYAKWSTMELSYDNLPPSVTHFVLNSWYGQSLDHLPLQLQYLHIKELQFERAKPTIDHLPTSLTHLYLPQYFDSPLDHLPDSLLHLCIYSLKFSYGLDHLPKSLKHLEFHSYTPVDNLPTITSLAIGFSGSLVPLDHLPSSLLYLVLQATTIYEFNLSCLAHLPRSITNVRLQSLKGVVIYDRRELENICSGWKQ